ncbi:hypothetical protein STEG23_002339, partial [Scotinomys teguina]
MDLELEGDKAQTEEDLMLKCSSSTSTKFPGWINTGKLWSTVRTSWRHSRFSEKNLDKWEDEDSGFESRECSSSTSTSFHEWINTGKLLSTIHTSWRHSQISEENLEHWEDEDYGFRNRGIISEEHQNQEDDHLYSKETLKREDTANVKHLVVQTDVDLMVVTFCIKYCHHVKRLQLNWDGNPEPIPRTPKMVLSRWNPITDTSWKILFSTLEFTGSLEELDLSGNPVSHFALWSLCRTLRCPGCQLRTLWLVNCGLTARHCADLASVFRASTNLLVLDLQLNDLGDRGVRVLCEGIKNAICNHRILRLDKAPLSDEVMMELMALQAKNPQLLISSFWTRMESVEGESREQKEERFRKKGEALSDWIQVLDTEKGKGMDPTSREALLPVPSYSAIAKAESERPRKPRVMDPTKNMDVEEMDDKPNSFKWQGLQAESFHLSAPDSPRDKHLEPLGTEGDFWGPTGPVATEVIDRERNLYRVQFPVAGSYHCPNTGLCFVVARAVTIEIKFCAWSQYLDETPLCLSHMVAGPLFDIKVEQGAVTTVYLPHFVDLQEGQVDISRFHVAHFQEHGMVLETPARVEQRYAVLENPSFSPVGVLMRKIPTFGRFIRITSITLIYYHFNPKDVTFHLYLVPNDCTIRKAIDDEEIKFHFFRINKPPPVDSLYIGSRYIVSGSKKLEIIPKELELCYRSPEKSQLFSEIYVGCMGSGIKLQIKDKKHKNLIWEALLKP